MFFGLHPLRVESVVWVSERKDARRKQLPEKYAAIHVARADILKNLGRYTEAFEAAESAIRESTGKPVEAYVRLRDDLSRFVKVRR